MKKIRNLLFVILLLLSLVTVSSCKKENKKLRIGILQLATHDALNASREGFIEALSNAGFKDGENITITIKNPEGDINNMNQYASKLVRESDLVLGIATDAAVALKNARDNNGLDIPVLFTAVTDPVSDTVGLIPSYENTSNNVTGTSDMNDVATQISMIKKVLPEASSMAVLFHASEVNSQVQARLAKEAAEAKGITVTNKTFNEEAEISSLLVAIKNGGFDVVYIPTDNAAAKNMANIASALNEAKILTVCGEESQVKNGGCLSYSINYKDLGIQTGNMAVRILNGEKVSNVHAERGLATAFCMNEESLIAVGLVPEEVERIFNK